MIQVIGENNRQKICRVCSDRAMGFNFNAITCESCKAFFRRNAFKPEKLRCPFNDDCVIDKSSRRFCQKCRLKKCLQVGMRKEWILSEEQKKKKQAKIVENRLKRKSTDNLITTFGPNDEGSSDHQADNSMEHFTSTRSDHPSCSSPSSSLSQYGGDSYVNIFSPGNSSSQPSAPLTGLLNRKESTSVNGSSLGSLLAPKSGNQIQQHSTSSSSTIGLSPPPTSILIEGTSDSPINLGSSGRYNSNLKTSTSTSPLSSLVRDTLDADWVSLITDPSTDQILDNNNTNENDNIDDESTVNDHDGNSENMDKSTSDPVHPNSRVTSPSIQFNLTSSDIFSSSLEPINKNNNRDDYSQEPWKSEVNNLILESNFTAIYLRNGKLDESDCSLNDLETHKINELIQSFSVISEPMLDHSFSSDSGITDVIKFSDLAIRRLIKWCKKINAFSSLCMEDQMALLKAGCLEMLSIKASYNFNIDDESWQDKYTKNGIKLAVLCQASEKLYQAHRQFIKTFNQRWRTDHTVNLLLVVIVLFNPERPNLLHPATVRLEHYTYIYLLRRYLESKSDSICQARSDHYHLMMKIEALRELHEKTLRLYSDAGPQVVGPLLIEILDLK